MAVTPTESLAIAKDWASTAGTGGRQGAWGISGKLGQLIAYAGVVALILTCPCIAIFMWYTLTQLDGSLSQLTTFASNSGFQGFVAQWPKPTAEVWRLLAIVGAIQAALQYFVPGKKFLGPVSPRGNVPVYKANGLQCYFLSLVLFFSGWKSGLFNPARVYDLFGEIIAALSLFSLAFCVFLYVKGRFYPSTSDNGSNDSLVYDYFWGRELYPRIGKDFDLKTWTNCRMGMMSWVILPLCWAIKQQELYGSVSNSMIVSVALIEVYCFKFFLWETGYWKTMDIAHDRAGYYLCWGCLVWVPSIYTSQPLFLVEHPYQMSSSLAWANFIFGVLCIYINYDADRQRQVFRETNGKLKVWGKKPKVIIAKYKSGDGKECESKLLASGWWGLSRHWHYVPEILASVAWTYPVVSSGAILPWFYVIFLTLLLTDRSFRDEHRCSSKYGSHWARYCKAVPYKIIPYVF